MVGLIRSHCLTADPSYRSISVPRTAPIFRFDYFPPCLHSDAPLLSTDTDALEQYPINGDGSKAGTTGGAETSWRNQDHDQWDDEALAMQTTKRTVVVAAVPSSNSQQTRDLLDMKSLDLKGNEEEQIAEKLRIEDNRAALARAKEGMEREAQRIKEEKQKKEQAADAASSSRFGAAGASVGGSTGGKWVPSHRLRDGAGASRWGAVGGGGSQKLDTDDQELFPDLAAADAILEKQKQDQVAYQPPKKTPVGGGASWASQSSSAAAATPGTRPKLNLKPKAKPADATTTNGDNDGDAPVPVAAEPASEPAESSPARAESQAPVESQAAAAPVAASTTTASTGSTAAPIKPTKKNKKDVSTFGKK